MRLLSATLKYILTPVYLLERCPLYNLKYSSSSFHICPSNYPFLNMFSLQFISYIIPRFVQEIFLPFSSDPTKVADTNHFIYSLRTISIILFYYYPLIILNTIVIIIIVYSTILSLFITNFFTFLGFFTTLLTCNMLYINHRNDFIYNTGNKQFNNVKSIKRHSSLPSGKSKKP